MKVKFNKIKNDKGMTLVELLIVMAILGVLVAIGSDIFISYRAKSYDTAAMSDGRQLLSAVMNSVIADDDVDYNHGLGDGNRVGATDTDGNPRDPILFLSTGTVLETVSVEDDPGAFYLEANLYSTGGTVGREFTCYISQVTGISECSFD